MPAPLTMLDVIKLGASGRPIPAPCPICGRDAPLISRDIRRGEYFLQCETYDCPTHVRGETPSECWAAWNRGKE